MRFHRAGLGGVVLCVMLAFVLLSGPTEAAGQSNRYGPDVNPPPTYPGMLPDTETVPRGWEVPVPEWLDYDSEAPPDWYERDWRFRMRHHRAARFARDYYRPYGRYRGRFYRGPGPYYDSQLGGYGVPRGGRFGAPDRYGFAWGGYAGGREWAFDEGYVQGHRDGKRFADWEWRYQRGSRSYLDAMRTGVDAFNHGDYSVASRQFILAAKLNQGDAAARLHAAHAMVALGHYADAALAVRRALQLQPKLVYLELDIRADYMESGDFARHYETLLQAAEATQYDSNLWFLLGYYQFFSGKQSEAYRSLQRSDHLDPGQRTTQRMLQAAKLSSPVEPAPPPRNARPPTEPAAEGQTQAENEI